MRTLNNPTQPWQRVLLLATTLLITSCTNNAGAATTTPTTPPETIPATTTTTPTTTTPATTTPTTTTTTTISPSTTTTPPSTVPATDTAKAQIDARLNSIWPAWDACRANPPGCQVDELANEYSTADAPAAMLFRSVNDYLLSHGQHLTELDKVERFVASIDVTGNDAVTNVCQRDGSIGLSASGAVVDDEVGLFRFEWVWSKINGKWMVVGGQNIQINEKGSATCDPYFE